MEKTCVFVDGENLRHAICDLFKDCFEAKDYLPNKANWSDFFDKTTELTNSPKRFRAYWFTINYLDIFPDSIEKIENIPQTIDFFSRKSTYFLKKYSSMDKSNKADVEKLIDDTKAFLCKRRDKMKKRFEGWHKVQDAIQTQGNAIEFRRAGAIRYDCFTDSLGTEKAVDVKLAVDLIKLQSIYDVAILVSGDQDYVPAVQAVKDMGKRVINICFKNQKGFLLPGGSKHLNKISDSSYAIEYDRMKSFMGLSKSTLSTASASS